MIKPIACIAVILLASCATPPIRTIKVIGEAKRFVPPTSAFVRLNVDCKRPTPLQASLALDSSMLLVQSYCRRANVPPTDLSSDTYDVSEHLVRRRTGPNNHELDSSSGWRAMTAVSVHLKKLSEIDSLVTGLTAIQGLAVVGISFHLDSTERINDTLRREAIKDARSRAEAMAQSLGCSVGDPISIEDEGTRILRGADVNDQGLRARFFGINGRNSTRDLLSGVGGIVQDSRDATDYSLLGSAIAPGLFLLTRGCNAEFVLECNK